MDSRGRHCWRRIQPRLVVLATLASVAACTVGMPVPAVVTKSQSGVRYPCEHHACGCVDAAACWKQCCCFTDAQKLAWAKREGVDPPAALVAAVARNRAPRAPAARGGHACCRAKAHGHDAPGAGAAAERCVARETRSDRGDCAAGSARHGGRRTAVHFVSIQAALQCQGLILSVSSLPPSLPASTAVSLPPDAERAFFVPREAVLYEPPALSIASPPPDLATAS